MARVSAAFYEESELPVEIQTEQFSFGQVVYCTIGSFSTPDTITFLLKPSQLAVLAAAVQACLAQQNAAAGKENDDEIA